jgi:hypothetical protein
LAKRGKSDDEYKAMARTLRKGFIDPETTDDFDVKIKDSTKAAVTRDLRRKGYAVGDELDYDPDTGVITDVRRSGKIARGFSAADGFDLGDVESWTPQQKQKVSRVFNQIKQLTERPYYVYRGRKKENIERLQEATSPHGYPAEVDIAFIPVARPGEKPEVKFTTDEVEIDDEPTTIETVEIIERDVARKPIYWADVGVSEELLREHPRQAVMKMHAAIGAKEYSPMSGAHSQPESYGVNALVREIRDLQFGYPERWPKFLLGLQAFSFPRQTDIAGYRKSRTKAKTAQQKVREKDRRAFRKTTKGRKQ